MNDLQIYLLGDALDYQKDKLLEFVEVLRGKKSITYYLGKYGLTGQALYSLCVLCDFDIKKIAFVCDVVNMRETIYSTKIKEIVLYCNENDFALVEWANPQIQKLVNLKPIERRADDDCYAVCKSIYSKFDKYIEECREA